MVWRRGEVNISQNEKSMCGLYRKRNVLEKLRRIDHKRYLFGIKRSVDVNSWSSQKVVVVVVIPPFWKPKVLCKAVKYFIYPWDCMDQRNRKESDWLLLRTFSLSLFLFSILSLFMFCFFRPYHHRSTMHDITSNHRPQTYLCTCTPHTRTLHFVWPTPQRLTASGMPSFHSLWPNAVINCLRDWPLALTTYLS